MRIFSLIFSLFFSILVIAASGTLREDFRKTIQTALPEIKTCYTDHLKKDSGAAGKIVLSIEINDQGKTASVKADEKKSRWQSNAGRGHEQESLNTITHCIGDKLKAMTFSAPDKGQTVVVEYPFVFGPR